MVLRREGIANFRHMAGTAGIEAIGVGIAAFALAFAFIVAAMLGAFF